MHIVVEGKKLREALSRSGPVATRATGHGAEMYSSVRLEANADTLTITAANPELQIKQRIPAASLIRPGTLLIPREQLIRIAKETETMEIEEKKNQIHISAPGTIFRLNKPAVEPPEREAVKDGRSLFLRGGELKQLLKQTLRFASRDSTKLILNGILLETRPQETRAVATDGHRLSLSTLPCGNGDEPVRITLPSQMAQLILGVAADEEDVEIRIGDNTIEASGPEYEIQGALLEGEFPDYEKVIPRKNPHAAEIRRKELLESLHRLKLIADQSHCGVRLSFSNEKLKLEIQNPNIGEATETLEMEGGDKVPEIGMNVGYLIDALESMGEDKVKVEVKDANSPALVTGDSHNPIIVIMPMRL
ncbi:MAG: DNA polymerase III subunit beta [Candidatus Binatia bacterium]